MTDDQKIALMHQAACKNAEAARYLGIGPETLRKRQRALGLGPRRSNAGVYAPKPEDVCEADRIALIRERDMLRTEVEILRAERSKLIKEGKL